MYLSLPAASRLLAQTSVEVDQSLANIWRSFVLPIVGPQLLRHPYENLCQPETLPCENLAIDNGGRPVR